MCDTHYAQTVAHEWTVIDVRLIDADKFEAVLDNVFDHLYDNGKPDLAGTLAAFVNMLTKQPTVDAVQVVRCKDCKHNVANWEHDELDMTDYTDIVCDFFMTDGMSPNDFCSHGERRHE